MFNDFEIIGSEVSYEVKEVRSEEYEAIEEIHLPENEKNLNGGFFEEKKRPSKKNSICEKLKSKNSGMFCIFILKFLLEFYINGTTISYGLYEI